MQGHLDSHGESGDAYVDVFLTATRTFDRDGKARAALKVVRGSQRVSRRKYLRHLAYRIVTINGEAGLVAYYEKRPVRVMTIETDGVRILAAYAVLNPNELTEIA